MMTSRYASLLASVRNWPVHQRDAQVRGSLSHHAGGRHRLHGGGGGPWDAGCACSA